MEACEFPRLLGIPSKQIFHFRSASPRFIKFGCFEITCRVFLAHEAYEKSRASSNFHPLEKVAGYWSYRKKNQLQKNATLHVSQEHIQVL